MALEVVAALALGVLVLWLVFEPSLRPARSVPSTPLPPEPEAPEETRRGVALLALKEIEFDRATGKLSDRDYEMLKGRYAAEALAALEAEAAPAVSGGLDAPDPEALVSSRLQLLRSAGPAAAGTRSCLRCGPRPEPDARFCSRCGVSLEATAFCSRCGTALDPESRFCRTCGSKVAA